MRESLRFYEGAFTTIFMLQHRLTCLTVAINRDSYRHVQPPEPVRHRRKPPPFAPRFAISPETAAALRSIVRLDQELDRFVLRARDYLALVEQAWASNFHASTSLEGNPMTLPEVKRLTSTALGTAAIPAQSTDPYTQEIVNHLFVWLVPGAMSLPWTVAFVQRLHEFLMTGVDKDAEPGQLSRRQMTVRRGQTPIFYGAPPATIAEELADLMLWTNGQGPGYHPVVAAAIMFHEFESIHPFADGNGRVGRALFHAYLQNAGLKNAHLCLIEQTLVADSDLYYRILAWADDRLDYTDLVRYFAEAVLDSYQKAKQEFQAKDLLSKGMDENRRILVVEAKRHGDWFSAREAAQWADGVVHATVLKHLKALVEDDVLEEQGATKSKRYRFKSPFREVELAKAERLQEIRDSFERSKEIPGVTATHQT